MTGMFQSSRIASGRPRLQTSSAFSPSSASTIWKSSPSRMRRATLRITLESSTTRHVLMLASISSKPGKARFPRHSLGRAVVDLCRELRWLNLQHAIDIEDDHELTVEAVDAAGELGHAGIEVDGVFLAAVVSQGQDFAGLVDQEAVGF